MPPPEFRRIPMPDNEFTVDQEHQPTMETAYADDLKLRASQGLNDELSAWLPPKDPHPTELRCPEQCREFRRILDRMYQLHLDKNQDYSPYNVVGAGEVGIVTRIWDKVARIMNLTGFDLRTGDFKKPEIPPANETIEDSYLDNANHSVIALVFRAGKWGK